MKGTENKEKIAFLSQTEKYLHFTPYRNTLRLIYTELKFFNLDFE